MSYKLIVTDTAEQHVIKACVYYEEQQPGLSQRFLSELYNAYKMIAEHPEYSGYISPTDKYRDTKIYKFPFVVIYEIRDNEIIVVAVFNTHKKPLY